MNVDLVIKCILLPQTKNGEVRVVHLNELAMMVLTSLPVIEETKPSDRLVEGITPAQVSVNFRRVCKKIEITNFCLHDLRHTAANWMRMSGADIHTVALLLGHKDLRSAVRYQHLSPAFLTEAVRKLDDVFSDIRYRRVTKEKALTDENL